MKLTFLGAAGQVTGSQFLLETKKSKVLVDCGMFQGSDFNEAKNHDAFAFNAKKLDAVIVTHAHLDHSGRIPKLVHEGFKGVIYGTKGTLKLSELIWEDALSIMAYEHRKFGTPMLFHTDDLPVAVSLCRSTTYNKWITLKDIRFRFHDAGHIFGSSFVELETEGKRLVFSGDMGNSDVPILRDTEPLPNKVDLLVLESTYGDRLHETHKQRAQLVKEYVVEALHGKGTLLIPAFSIERTQELLYYLKQIIEGDKRFPKVPIFLDSPLAIKAIEVYREHPEYYDREAALLRKMGGDFFKVPGLKMTLTRDESKMINNKKGSKIIIAGSGMMNGGRIVHHLLRYIDKKSTTVLIVGYQAQNTLGRKLYDGEKEVTILGQQKKVRAKIKAIGALSAHADQKKLVQFARSATRPPQHIYLTHGEDDARSALTHKLHKALPNTEIVSPHEGDSVTL